MISKLQVKKALAMVPGVLWFKHRVVDRFQSRPRIPVQRPADRGAGWASVTEVTAAEVSGQQAAEPTFALVRVIGNDLTPRHAPGQSRANLAFILEHEPDLPGCTKSFVVNRIADADEEQAILNLLDRAGVPFVHLPYEPDTYAQAGWDIDGVPLAYAPHRALFDRLQPDHQARILARLYRHKNNAVIHNNGARNVGLAAGREWADWVLPWDGNCFVTAEAWQAIRAGVANRPDLPLWTVPMARITDNQALLEPGFAPPAEEEPQVLMRSDLDLRFDERWFYGRRPKVELFWRLGIPGPWDHWPLEPWDLPFPEPDRRLPEIGRAGWMARLYSGQAALEQGTNSAARTEALVGRGRARIEAITGLLDRLDNTLLAERLDPLQPVFVTRGAIQETGEEDLAALRKAAKAALQRGPFSVVDKTTLPPSRNPHDYWHPAPYYWPHPLRLPGLPHVQRDGKRVPGTHLYEPASERYDRTRWQRLVDDVWALTLVACHDARLEPASAAVDRLRHWFLNPETAMNPHLDYAQVRQGHNGNRGASTGIIELKDLYYLLDAIRLLHQQGALPEADLQGLRYWFERYLDWLVHSEQGRQERASANNHGTYFDLQVGALAAFLGRWLLLRDTLRDSRFRLREQFAADGSQPHELARADTAHYCCFNLQGWMYLAELAAWAGEDLWAEQGPEGQSLDGALSWLMQYHEQPWPHRQQGEFDALRFWPLWAVWQRRQGLVALPARIREVRACFHPHDGIRPFWRIQRGSVIK